MKDSKKWGKWIRITGSIRARLFLDSVNQKRGVQAGAGAHFYFILTEENGKNFIEFGATHHGVKFNCTDVNGEFEKVINMFRKEYPENATD